MINYMQNRYSFTGISENYVSLEPPKRRQIRGKRKLIYKVQININ